MFGGFHAITVIVILHVMCLLSCLVAFTVISMCHYMFYMFTILPIYKNHK